MLHCLTVPQQRIRVFNQPNIYLKTRRVKYDSNERLLTGLMKHVKTRFFFQSGVLYASSVIIELGIK
jgi:hypothetical protein